MEGWDAGIDPAAQRGFASLRKDRENRRQLPLTLAQMSSHFWCLYQRDEQVVFTCPIRLEHPHESQDSVRFHSIKSPAQTVDPITILGQPK